jgi:tRNA pseudouridine(55) synthase
MIIPVYKPLGASSHQLAKKVGELHNTKATHTGTLDPMAEGVMVVLTDEDRFKKEEFGDWKKEYEFEILWGVNTDTHDLLGLATKINVPQKIDFTQLNHTLKNFLGTQQQQLPKFSAKRIAGQSYFDLAKNNQQFHPQAEEINIYKLELIESYLIGRQKFWESVQVKIKLLKGDFRQEEILKNWQQTLKQLPTKLQISKFKTTTSKRTYVRSLVRDISRTMKIPATTHSITRTANGKFTLEDCQQLSPDLF